VEAEEERTPLEDLDEAECWARLSEVPVGRIGVVYQGAPEIYPVNYVVDDGTIVFRTGPGTKLAGLAGHPAVCFQIDGIDVRERTGWSVLVKGQAQQVRGEQRDRVEDLPLDYWPAGRKWFWIRVVPTEVTGRRVRHSGDG
jgi:nitroimidazol reductase NimA-like FMN-containing flavoprotein (pyridoxamine 5'-phosphate oxidase superfamily)